MADFFEGKKFFILPLGLGAKRLEFFEAQIKKFKGVVVKAENAEHVVIEDSVSGNKEKCLSAMKTQKVVVKKDVKYLTTKWLSKCFADQVYYDVEPFRIVWINDVSCVVAEKDCVKKKCGESSGEDTSPKKQKFDEKVSNIKIKTRGSRMEKQKSLSPSCFILSPKNFPFCCCTLVC